MMEVAYKQGDQLTLKSGVVPEDLVSAVGESPLVTVVGMEHEYGYNRFVMVELGDEDNTRMIVRPDELY
jgi:hypothetical protein